MRYSPFKVLSTALLAMSMAAPAFALTATQVVEKEVVVKQENGDEKIERVAAELVVPGERIIYTLNFVNDDAEPATDLVLTMPVPAEVDYMDGSASKKDMRAIYSVDGGQTFLPRGERKIKETDGSYRSASAEEITHIRWVVPGPVPAGAQGQLSYKAILK